MPTDSRVLAALGALAVLAGCTAQSAMPKPIEFLTRSGCVQTKIMLARTETAIKALALPSRFTVVDLDTLPADDARRGYGTPTLLIGGVDPFGMPTPTPPYPEPT